MCASLPSITLPLSALSNLYSIVIDPSFLAIHKTIDEDQVLCDACINGDLPKVSRLLASGCDVNFPMGMSEATPLHFACAYEKYDVAQYLIDHGADIYKLNSDDITPLGLAGVSFAHKTFVAKEWHRLRLLFIALDDPGSPLSVLPFEMAQLILHHIKIQLVYRYSGFD